MQKYWLSWLNGVSTRKIENIANRLGIESLSASEVSEINNGLDEMVDEFRTRKLEAEYPVIWADALYEKIFVTTTELPAKP